ncbi:MULTISPECIES: hypothetical protein [unclassified Bradyrhizobium]
MVETAEDRIVIDYQAGGYRACTAMDAIHGHANRQTISRAGQMKTLGEMLADDFLDCNIGKPGLVFDPVSEKWLGLIPAGPRPEHVITTTVSEVRDVDRR